MSDATDWGTAFQAEIAAAENARQGGNEGKARVCARRAAGIVASEYLRRAGAPITSASAYDLLKLLKNSPGLPPQVARISEHFIIRLTPEFELPIQADLVAEARWLRQALLEEPEK